MRSAKEFFADLRGNFRITACRVERPYCRSETVSVSVVATLLTCCEAE